MANLVKKVRTDKGDLQIDYGALANLPSINNNLLINSDFRHPVNQRGQTTYTEGTARYGIDRWFLYNSTREVVNSSSITVTNVGQATTWFAQKFEHPLDNSESYAITVKVGTIVGSGVNVSIGNQDEATTRHTLQTGINTFVVEPNEISSSMEQFVITLPVGASIELIYAKLEQGATATSFVPRLFAEELALCQRYYEERTLVFFPLGGTTPTQNFVAVNGGQHFVEKRSVPTVAVGTLYDYTGADSGATVKSNTCTAKSLRAINLNASCDDYMIRAAVTFDAEVY